MAICHGRQAVRAGTTGIPPEVSQTSRDEDGENPHAEATSVHARLIFKVSRLSPPDAETTCALARGVGTGGHAAAEGFRASQDSPRVRRMPDAPGARFQVRSRPAAVGHKRVARRAQAFARAFEAHSLLPSRAERSKDAVPFEDTGDFLVIRPVETAPARDCPALRAGTCRHHRLERP